jgi:hypothetical protein
MYLTTFEEFSIFYFHRLAHASKDLPSTDSNSLAHLEVFIQSVN